MKQVNCSAKCQRSNWKKHKTECKRAIIIPLHPPPNMDDVEQEKIEIHSMQSIKQVREKFNHHKAYTEFTHTQFEPSNAMLKLFIDVLLSPFTFWNIKSINIQCIPTENENKKLLKVTIDNLFGVISKLPKLKELRISDMNGSSPDPNTFLIRRGYISSFGENKYKSLQTMYIPIDDVFYSLIDYSDFTTFIKHSCKIKSIDMNVRYYGNYAHSPYADEAQDRSFLNATENILESIQNVEDLEELDFEISDIAHNVIDSIDERYSQILFNGLCALISSQISLCSLSIRGRPFSKSLQDHMGHILSDKCKNLTELHLNGNDMRPNAQAFENVDNLLDLIKTQE